MYVLSNLRGILSLGLVYLFCDIKTFRYKYLSQKQNKTKQTVGLQQRNAVTSTTSDAIILITATFSSTSSDVATGVNCTTCGVESVATGVNCTTCGVESVATAVSFATGCFSCFSSTKCCTALRSSDQVINSKFNCELSGCQYCDRCYRKVE